MMEGGCDYFNNKEQAQRTRAEIMCRVDPYGSHAPHVANRLARDVTCSMWHLNIINSKIMTRS